MIKGLGISQTFYPTFHSHCHSTSICKNMSASFFLIGDNSIFIVRNFLKHTYVYISIFALPL